MIGPISFTEPSGSFTIDTVVARAMGRQAHTCCSHPPSSQAAKCTHYQALSPQHPITQATNAYSYKCTKAKTGTGTHTYVQTHTRIYMQVRPVTHTASPAHLPRSRHPREGTLQGLLTSSQLCWHTASRSWLFSHGYFHLLLDDSRICRHRNQLFSCKLQPRKRKERRVQRTHLENQLLEG